MKKILFVFLALVVSFASCDRSELLDPEMLRPVIPVVQPTVTITGDGMSPMPSTRSTDGRVEFTGGYATGAGLYAGTADAVVKAVPYSGYKLVSFIGGPVSGSSSQFSGSDNYKFNIQSQDWQFNVSFKQEFTISVSAEDGGTASGGGAYGAGESCTLVATPNSGKIFDGWYEGGSKISSDVNYSFAVSSNRTLHRMLHINLIQ